jgi:purine-binding chemotaxis protein CheW
MDMITEASEIARQQRAAAAGRPTDAAAAPQARAGEYLTFRLGAEEYGIDILRVQEIRSYEQPTRVADAPAFLRGVVNLRGIIVPIVDLRLKLGCEQVAYNHFTVVLVLNVRGRVVGAVVDAVSDVLELGAEQIQAAPVPSARIDAGCITGLGTVAGSAGERRVILIDIEALMGSAETGLVGPR